MNEKLLSSFREEPRADFARDLYARIERSELAEVVDFADRRRRQRWVPMAAAAALFVTSVVMISSPSARAAAQQFLDMFRVKRFAAVAIDRSRIDQLRDGNIDMKTILGDSIEVLKEPGPPVEVTSLAEASQSSEMELLAPTYILDSDGAPSYRVVGDGAFRYTADAERLQSIVDALGIADVSVPQNLDGAQVTVNIPRAVGIRYRRNGKWIATFIQANSPQIVLPPGVDLAQIGEIGLRITGLSADEAKTFASKIDWNSTLLVPVPADAAAYHDVDVRGTTGLLIEIDRENRGPQTGKQEEPARTLLLWSEGGRVYAISSTRNPMDVLEMANSLQDE